MQATKKKHYTEQIIIMKILVYIYNLPGKLSALILSQRSNGDHIMITNKPKLYQWLW